MGHEKCPGNGQFVPQRGMWAWGERANGCDLEGEQTVSMHYQQSSVRATTPSLLVTGLSQSRSLRAGAARQLPGIPSPAAAAPLYTPFNLPIWDITHPLHLQGMKQSCPLLAPAFHLHILRPAIMPLAATHPPSSSELWHTAVQQATVHVPHLPCPIVSNPILFHPIPTHSIPFHPTSSHANPFHPIPLHLVPSHPILSCPVPSSLSHPTMEVVGSPGPPLPPCKPRVAPVMGRASPSPSKAPSNAPSNRATSAPAGPIRAGHIWAPTSAGCSRAVMRSSVAAGTRRSCHQCHHFQRQPAARSGRGRKKDGSSSPSTAGDRGVSAAGLRVLEDSVAFAGLRAAAGTQGVLYVRAAGFAELWKRAWSRAGCSVGPAGLWVVHRGAALSAVFLWANSAK